MKIIPITVEKAIQTDYKFVEWMIHNVCNYNCSFCDNEFKDGSLRWVDLETYKSYADKIIDACGGKPFWFRFTGGEPTLYPNLIELMKYVKSRGAYVSLISNGSRTVRYWEEMKQAKCVDQLGITCHTEQISDYKHIVNVLNIFHEEPIETHCFITHTKDTVDKAILAKKVIEHLTGAIIILKAMNIKDYDIYSKYTDHQLKQIKTPYTRGAKFKTKKLLEIEESHKFSDLMKITYDDGSMLKVNSQTLFKNKENNFFNYNCNIGNDTMRIEKDNIYRGVCKAGGIQYNLATENQVSFTSDSVNCTLKECFCATDLVAKKFL